MIPIGVKFISDKDSVLFNVKNGPFKQCESHSDMSDSSQPHRLYSPWSSPGQNIGVGSLSLLQWIFPTQESNKGLLHCRRIRYDLYQTLYDYTVEVMNRFNGLDLKDRVPEELWTVVHNTYSRQ